MAAKKLPDVVYALTGTDLDSSYLLAFETIEDAVEASDGSVVGTYKLQKTAKYKVKKTIQEI